MNKTSKAMHAVLPTLPNVLTAVEYLKQRCGHGFMGLSKTHVTPILPLVLNLAVAATAAAAPPMLAAPAMAAPLPVAAGDVDGAVHIRPAAIAPAPVAPELAMTEMLIQDDDDDAMGSNGGGRSRGSSASSATSIPLKRSHDTTSLVQATWTRQWTPRGQQQPLRQVRPATQKMVVTTVTIARKKTRTGRRMTPTKTRRATQPLTKRCSTWPRP
jgi:hypothetical protein